MSRKIINHSVLQFSAKPVRSARMRAPTAVNYPFNEALS